MKYKVIKIEEDLDFGCEERSEDTPVQAVVTLTDEDGETITQKFSDAALVKENIQPGDEVIIDESGDLKKGLINSRIDLDEKQHFTWRKLIC